MGASCPALRCYILSYANMLECDGFKAKYDIDVLQARLHRLKSHHWWVEASEKLKLRTFVKIYDTVTPSSFPGPV